MNTYYPYRSSVCRYSATISNMFNELPIEIFDTEEWIRSIAYDLDGSLAAGLGNGILRIWRPDGTIIEEFPYGSESVNSVAYGPPSHLAAAFNRYGRECLIIFSPETTFKFPTDGRCVVHLAYGIEGTLAAALDNGNLKIWRPDGKIEDLELDGVTALAFDPNSGNLAIGTPYNLQIITQEGQIRTLMNADHGIAAVAYGPDGTLVAGAHLDNTLRFWRPDGSIDYFQINDYLPNQWGVRSLAFDPYGVFAVGLSSAEGEGRVIVQETDQPIQIMRTDSRVMSVAFDPYSGNLAAGTQRGVFIWDRRRPGKKGR